MRINALELDGYGVWTGLKLDGFPEGLSVIYGPNEAGKTTLMQFVRSVLYGFGGRRRCYLPPLRGGRPGGSLYVTGPEGNYQVSRHQNPEHPDDGDQVALYADDGARHGEAMLKTLLSDVDEKIFNNVFAVGLHELQELSTLSDTEAAAQLYNLSVGLDRVSLVTVVRELETSRKRLLDPSGRPCQIVQLFGQRQRLYEELETLGAATDRYAALAAEHKEADREVVRLEEENARLKQQLRTVEAAVAVRERWSQAAALAAQLSALDAAAGVPEGAVRRLEAINARLQRYHQHVKRFKHQRQTIREEAAGLEINEALWRLAPRVEALSEQEDWITSLQRRTAELETEIGGLETELRDERVRLGLDDAPQGGRLPDLSSRRLAELRRPARQVRQLKQRVREAEEEVSTARETARQLNAEIDAALTARGETDLADSMARAGGLVAQLRRRLHLDQRLEQMTAQQVELESQSRELLGRQLLPAWVLIGIGAVFVVGVLTLLAGLFMPESITGGLGWPLALLGLVGTVAAVAAKFSVERTNTRQLDACHKQVAMLDSQIKQARADRDQLDAELPSAAGPLEARLETAERVLASLEELVPLDARRQAAEQEAETAGFRAAEAKREASAAAARWRDSLELAGLPGRLSPKQVRELMASGSRIDQIQRQLDLRYEEFQQRTRELDAINGRIAQLSADAGVPADQTQPIEQIRLLAARVSEQQGRLARRETLRRQTRRLRSRLAKAEMAVSRLKHLKRKLFHTAGVQSEDHLRRLADEAARAAGLRRQHEALEREIDAAMAGRTTREAVAEQLAADRDEPLEARRDQLQKRFQAVESGLRQEFERRGRLVEQLKQLGEDRTPAARQLELGLVEERLAEAVRSWRKLAVAGRILNDVRATYERERQPATLQAASTYLDSLTEGRYPRVWTPLDEDVLLVDDARGESLPVEVLSQGTREQLFVCLRLALAGGYAERGASLPVVLDDVLVNFDSRRAKTAAAVLRDFAAEGHQMLVFTCHEHIVKIFKSLRVDVLTLPDNSETGVTISVSSAAPKSRRKPKAEPEVVPEEPVRQKPAAAAIEAVEDEEVDEEFHEEPIEIDEEPVEWEAEVAEEDEEELDFAEEEYEEEPEEEDFEEEEYDEEDYEEEDDDAEELEEFEDAVEDEFEEELEDEGEEEIEDDSEDDLFDEEEEEEEIEAYDEADEYDEGEEYDEADEEALGRRRRFRDDWDDRYEDEYEHADDEDGPDDGVDGAEAA